MSCVKWRGVSLHSARARRKFVSSVSICRLIMLRRNMLRNIGDVEALHKTEELWFLSVLFHMRNDVESRASVGVRSKPTMVKKAKSLRAKHYKGSESNALYQGPGWCWPPRVSEAQSALQCRQRLSTGLAASHGAGTPALPRGRETSACNRGRRRC